MEIERAKLLAHPPYHVTPGRVAMAMRRTKKCQCCLLQTHVVRTMHGIDARSFRACPVCVRLIKKEGLYVLPYKPPVKPTLHRRRAKMLRVVLAEGYHVTSAGDVYTPEGELLKENGEGTAFTSEDGFDLPLSEFTAYLRFGEDYIKRALSLWFLDRNDRNRSDTNLRVFDRPQPPLNSEAPAGPRKFARKRGPARAYSELCEARCRARDAEILALVELAKVVLPG